MNDLSRWNDPILYCSFPSASIPKVGLSLFIFLLNFSSNGFKPRTMKTEFRKSFEKDLKNIKDPNLLERVKSVIEEIESFAFGQLSLRPREFYDISPRHLSLMLKGYEDKSKVRTIYNYSAKDIVNQDMYESRKRFGFDPSDFIVLHSVHSKVINILVPLFFAIKIPIIISFNTIFTLL